MLHVEVETTAISQRVFFLKDQIKEQLSELMEIYCIFFKTSNIYLTKPDAFSD